MKFVTTIATGVLLAGMSTASFAGGHGFKCKVSERLDGKAGRVS